MVAQPVYQQPAYHYQVGTEFWAKEPGEMAQGENTAQISRRVAVTRVQGRAAAGL